MIAFAFVCAYLLALIFGLSAYAYAVEGQWPAAVVAGLSGAVYAVFVDRQRQKL